MAQADVFNSDIDFHEALRTHISKIDLEEIYARDGWECLRCASKILLTIDHIVPVSKGGKYTISNYQTLCQECNLAKGDSIIDYRHQDRIKWTTHSEGKIKFRKIKTIFRNHEIFLDSDLFKEDICFLFLYFDRPTISLFDILNSNVHSSYKAIFIAKCCELEDLDLYDFCKGLSWIVIDRYKEKEYYYLREKKALAVCELYLKDRTLYNPNEHGSTRDEAIFLYGKSKYHIEMDEIIEKRIELYLTQFINDLIYI